MAHWHILGAGSVGCLFAYKLSQESHNISLILKNHAQLKQFQAFGRITLKDLTGQNHAVNTSAATVEQITTPIKNLLVCTKSWQTKAAVRQVMPMLCPDANVVLLQNGMGQLEDVAPLLSNTADYCATTTDGVYKTAPFSIVHAGYGETLIGSMNENRQPMALADAIWLPDLKPALYKKLAINAAINPLTAIHNIKNGEILVNTECLQIISQLSQELTQIFDALGFNYKADEIEAAIIQVAKATAQNSSSMREDVNHGRRSEIEEINGYINRVAEQHQLDCPINLSLLQQVRQKSR